MLPIDHLITLLKADKVIPVVGAGVSFATAKIPGWKGVVENGLEYAKIRNLDCDNLIAKAKSHLANDQITMGANLMKELLNAPNHPFSDWLEHLFGDPVVYSRELLNSIHDLCAPIILTTNYDSLLYSGKLRSKQVFDWSQHELVARALHKNEELIFHLHGIYDKPKTVILGSDDYSELSSQLGYKTILRKLWMDYHFLFIGCSHNGVMDEDFATVFRFLNEWFPSMPHTHFILMSEQDITKGLNRELMKQCNVVAISFGSKHDQLPLFIEGFNPNKEKALSLTKAYLAELQSQLERQILLQSGDLRFRQQYEDESVSDKDIKRRNKGDKYP